MKTQFKQISKVFAVVLIALTVLGLQSCYKRNYTTQNNTTSFDNSKTVTSSIYGIVKDEAGMPVEGATVKTSGYTATTDDNGLFFFNNITTPSHASTVVVSKTGYFNGSRTLSVKANDKHTVHISLMAKGTPETFYANNGGTVSFAGGISISFPANAIVNKASGTPYNGQVFVYAKNIDPTTDMGRMTMPGDLRGIGTSGDEKILQSFGMMVAELYDMNGNALQIGNTSSATLSQTISASLQGKAKASIPLWYYDEAKGMWIEEGAATLIGNHYEGKVQHFSFWNCDDPYASIFLEMTLQDQNGNPLPGYIVRLTNTANLDWSTGSTNASGWVGGLCYSNAVLTLEVFNFNICAGNVLYTTTITTGAVNQNLGIITVNIAGAGCTFNAIVQDCLGAPVTNGAVYIPQLGLMLTPNALGQISQTLGCTPNTPITFLAYDFTNNVCGSSSYTLVPGVNNIGILSACGNVSPFLTITLTNTVSMVSASETILLPNSLMSSLQGPVTNLHAYNGNGYVGMGVDGITIGTFNVSSGYVSNIGAFADTFALSGVNSATFTSFPAFPGAVEGTYSLTLTGWPSGDIYTATGSFKLPRNN